MKSLYYQFVNFIQTMPALWFVTILFLLFAGSLVCIMKFFKIYNGTQKTIEKPSLLILSLLQFAVIIYLTFVR